MAFDIRNWWPFPRRTVAAGGVPDSTLAPGVGYNFPEPQWGFMGSAPNNVPYDVNAADELGLVKRLNRTHFRAGIPYAEPDVIGERGIRQPAYQGWLTATEALFVGHAAGDTLFRQAPPAPYYTDNYNQAVSGISGQYVVGQAPTTGLYTGIEDECLS